MLRVLAIACEGRRNLSIDNDIDLYARLRSSLQDLIESPLLIVERRSPQKQLRAQPPVGDIYGLFGPFQRDGYGIEVISTIHIPLDVVTISSRGKRAESMALRDLGSFGISSFLVRLVVTMIWIHEILELSDLVL